MLYKLSQIGVPPTSIFPTKVKLRIFKQKEYLNHPKSPNTPYLFDLVNSFITNQVFTCTRPAESCPMQYFIYSSSHGLVDDCFNNEQGPMRPRSDSWRSPWLVPFMERNSSTGKVRPYLTSGLHLLINHLTNILLWLKGQLHDF